MFIFYEFVLLKPPVTRNEE